MVFTPFPLKANPGVETTLYAGYSDLEKIDYRFKLVFNFTEKKSLNKFFSPIKASDISSLAKEAKQPETTPLSDLLKGAILHAR